MTAPPQERSDELAPPGPDIHTQLELGGTPASDRDGEAIPELATALEIGPSGSVAHPPREAEARCSALEEPLQRPKLTAHVAADAALSRCLDRFDLAGQARVTERIGHHGPYRRGRTWDLD
jgi:hypothetical protein